MYLITAKYGSDSERKRIEYALEKWRAKMDITKPEGIVAIVVSDDIEELVEELYSRTESKNVVLYHIEKARLDVTEGEKKLRAKINEKRETVEKLLDFIMARQKAILKIELTEPREKVYEVYTKKGKAEITTRLQGNDNSVDLLIRITGYGDALELLHRKLADELKILEG